MSISNAMIQSNDGGKPYMKEKNESKEKNKTRNEDKNEGKIIRVLEIYTRLLNGAVINKEEEAERWIRTSPVSFCDTHDKKVISQILNNYDQETTDFYRWKVRYSQAELSELIRQNTKSDYGDIIDLIPIQRGKIRTYLQTENCRFAKNIDYRKGTGNTPHSIFFPPVQLSLCNR